MSTCQRYAYPQPQIMKFGRMTWLILEIQDLHERYNKWGKDGY